MPKKYTFSFFLDSITVSMKNIWHGVLKFKAVDWLNKIYFLRWPNNFLAFLENDLFLGLNFSDLLSSKGSWEPKNYRIEKTKSVLSSSEYIFFRNQYLKVIQVSWFWGFCPPSGPLWTDLIVWLIQSHPKPKFSTFDQ